MKPRKESYPGCPSTGSVTKNVLLHWLAASTTIRITSASWGVDGLNSPNQIPFISSPSPYRPRYPSATSNKNHEFTLRHIFHHGTHEYPNVHVRMDIAPDESVWVESEEHGAREELKPLFARSRPEPIERLSDRSVSTAQSRYHAARMSGSAATLDYSEWTTDEVTAPNTSNKDTVLTLAKMSLNAYTKEPGTGEWKNINGTQFNYSQSFGWESDGLRGHIFADKDNSTIIISLKGTSMAVFDGAETTTNDKENDNIFFGCCCGQGGHYLWRQACDCMSSAYNCNKTCVVQALQEENRYYSASIELYGNVTGLYPKSNVWMTGHSLGGSTSALLGLTFGLPVTTFEAPGDALAAARLGLPSPPRSFAGAPQSRKLTGAVHFGHTADPVFMGTCNALTSGCTLAGYALQTQCHTGHVCIYDTVEDKSWRVGVGYHRIKSVIEDVIEAYDDVPPCRTDEECVDCFNWKYFESNGSDSTTTISSSSSSTTSSTRTTTCQTPGWWGCLDETSTMTTTSTSSSTSELPTTSCVKYGWFGGCAQTTTFSPTSSIPTITRHGDLLTTSCVGHGWLGGCTQTSTVTLFPTSCAKHGWFGRCISTATLSRTAAPAAAPVPTITTTRPLATVHKATS